MAGYIRFVHRNYIHILLIWLPGLIIAQEVPRVVSFTKSEYQAQNQNWSVAQGSDHTMYFGNSAGLLSFDGTHWKLNQLPHQQAIRSVASDHTGRIFTGAFNELGYWEADSSGTLQYHSLRSLVKHEKTDREEIWHILATPDLVLFQSFSTFHLFQNDKMVSINPPGNVMFVQEVNGHLFFQVIGQGIYELLSSRKFNFVEGSEFLGSSTVVSILPHAGAEFLVATAHNGIYIHKNGNYEIWNQQSANTLGNYQVNKVIRLSSGQYAIGTIQNGLFILNEKGGIHFHINQQNGLQNNTVLALKEDMAGDLWLGLDKGIDLVELTLPLTFHHDKSGFLGTVYSAAVFDNKLYVGTNQGVYAKKWGDSSSQHHNEFEFLEGSQGHVWELAKHNGQLICGHNNGTFIVNGKQVQKISDVTGGWMTVRHPDMPEYLIQGTYTGLIVYTTGPDGQWQFARRIEGLVDGVKQLAFDNEGYLWLANPIKGILRVRLDEKLTHIVQVENFFEEHGLPSDYHVDIMQLDDSLFFGVLGVYYQFDNDDRKFYPQASLTLSSDQTKVFNGRNGDRFSVSQGLLEYNNAAMTARYPVELVPEYENIVALDSQKYLICLSDGYAVLNTTQNQLPVKKIEASLRLNVVRSGDNILARTSSSEQQNVLKPFQNRIYFNYSQPVFTTRPKFSYYLEGFDENWGSWELRNEKEYANLNNGDYIFHVRSDHADNEITYYFTIKPVWYITNIAFAGYALCLLLFLVALRKYHRTKLSRQLIKLDDERERLLNEERMKTANERLQIDLINKSKELANSTMHLAQKNRALLSIKDELKDLRKTSNTNLNGHAFQHLMHVIDVNISSENDRQVFEQNFNQVHEQFLKRLSQAYPDLTHGDLRLAAYLKMNLSSKEISPLLNISVRSLENRRYRLRKKMKLDPSTNLTDFMMRY